MTDEQKRWAPLSSYLYKLVKVRERTGLEREARELGDLHALVLLQEASGALLIDDQKHTLQSGRLLWLQPHSVVQRIGPSESPLRYIEIGFRVYKEEGGPLPVKRLNVPAGMTVRHPGTFLLLAAEMRELQESGGWGAMKASIRLQELLLMLFQELARETESLQKLAIATTAEYMERHYRHGLTRELLADMAGMSPDYYARLFKKQTGKTPLAYLTDIRTSRAKQELLVSHDSFRTIAQNAGFTDEFYFSRKFKAVTGLSPSAYAKKMREAGKIASLQHHLTGHLLALGIEPYAALLNEAYPLGGRVRETLPVGGFSPDLDQLTVLQPELIFTSDYHDTETTRKVKMFEQIAQVVRIPFYDDWRSQLRKVAVATGREQAAALWLARYDESAAALRSSLPQAVRESAVLIVGVGNGKLCLFGRRNVGAVLYEDLRLPVAEPAQGLAHYRELTVEALFDAAAAADRLVLTSFKNDGSDATKAGIRRTVQRLADDPRWPELSAVKRGNVHAIFEAQHLYTLYTSYSHKLLLDVLTRLWITDLSK